MASLLAVMMLACDKNKETVDLNVTVSPDPTVVQNAPDVVSAPDIDDSVDSKDDESDYDKTTAEGQIKTFDLAVKNEEINLKYYDFYSVTDMNENGRLELLLGSKSSGEADLYEIDADNFDISKRQSIYLGVNSGGRMLIRRYENSSDNDVRFLAFNGQGQKKVFSFGDTVHNYEDFASYNSFQKVLPDTYVLTYNKDAWAKEEADYFSGYDVKKLFEINWKAIEDKSNLSKEDLLEVYGKNGVIDEFESDDAKLFENNTNCKVSTPDALGLSDYTIEFFGNMGYFYPDHMKADDADKDDFLSSQDYSDINWLLFSVRSEKTVLVHDFGYNIDNATYQSKISRSDWLEFMGNVFGESNPEALLAKLPTEFGGEMSVWYNSADDCVYYEVGAIGFGYEYGVLDSVEANGDEFTLKYYCCSDFQDYAMGYMYVTVVPADNEAGYRLVGVRKEWFDGTVEDR